MGTVGAPPGNQNATSGKVWQQALNRALEKRSNGKGRAAALDELAEKLLSLCDQADLGALKELGDRSEGKPSQSVAISGDSENPLQVIQRVILNSNNPNT